MRDLIECQAEVFRRSEKRIKLRRQRTARILAVCIPLVLCLVGIPLVSGFFPSVFRESPATDPAIHLQAGGQQESYICSIAKITVSGLNFSRSITEVSHILAVSDRLLIYDTYCGGQGTIANETAQDENTETSDDYALGAGQDINTTTCYAATGYTVTLVMHDGTQIPYTLIDCTLKNLTTGQSFVLPQEDAEQLAKLLQTLPGKD